MTSQTLKSDLTFIKAHLAFIPVYITKLEEQGLQLTDAVGLMEKARSKLTEVPGNIGEELKAKLDSVLQKNPGYDRVKTITGVLNGTSNVFPEGMGPGDIAMFKFCPTASVDVERSFSQYKNVLSDKRQSLTKENLKKIMMCHCHYNRK